MKLMKKIIAAVIAIIMTFAITGCHEKNEIAVTVNGFEYTSAYYMCALINAYLEGQQEVYTALGDKFTSNTDYFKQKIDDKKFDVWVKDRAIDIVKEVGTYQKLCKDAKLELSPDQMTNAQNSAYMNWVYYGYGQLFEPNGVSWNTYLQYTIDTAYSGLYFEYLYGKGGEKEIAAADVEAKLYKDFLIADLIDVTFSNETADEKTEIKEKLDGYIADLKAGKKTFEDVYNDYNDIKETEEEHDHDHDKEETKTEEDDKKDEEEKLEPLDEYAQLLGAKGTGSNFEHDNFDEIYKMTTNEVKLITKENNAGYILVVKKDIKADPYYLENCDLIVRSLLKESEFTKDMAKIIKTAKIDINSYAVDRFKVKKIKEPEY